MTFCRRIYLILFLGIFLPSFAQSKEPPGLDVFAGLKARPNELARHEYLINLITLLSGQDQVTAQQLLASTDSELGLHMEALSRWHGVAS